MTATAAPVSPKLASGPSRWRTTSNIRRARKLGRKTRPTNGNNIFRWYRSSFGRYTQSDPIGVGGGTAAGLNHLYGYAEDNPLTYSDPRGLYSMAGPCDDKLCGPPSEGQCFNNPRATICLQRPLQDMRDQAIRSKPCKQALINNGVNYDEFVRSLSKNTRKYPILSCDAGACAISGGAAKYFPLTRSIPLCANLFGGPAGFKGAAQSLFHEFLHDFGIGDGSAQQTNIMETCYPGFAP